ncbi:hypothetical protein I4F81_004527 [Pyropia yezoensis]|uniref:Uncharacterized protein n=1 Tax=Pyropia yezoensis TaxID=2788 RepID=A0ACC3BWV4_PYRYE|nr:hypothetical protein I4F81_004527 [Neopyropia yezoensis]
MHRRLDGAEDPPPGRPAVTAADGALVVVEAPLPAPAAPAPTSISDSERAFAGIPPPPPTLDAVPLNQEDDEPLTAWLDANASSTETIDAGGQSRSGVSTSSALQWGVLAVMAAMAANVISFRYSRATRGRPSGGSTPNLWTSGTRPGSGGGRSPSSSASAGQASSSSSSSSWGHPFSPWMGSSGDPRPDATPGAASARADAWAASVRAEAVRRAAARAAAAGGRPAAARGRWERVTTVRGPDGRVHTTRQSGGSDDPFFTAAAGGSPFPGGLPDMSVLEQLLRAQQAAARRAGGGGAGLGDAFRFWESVFMGHVPGGGGGGGPRARPRDGGGPSSSSSYGGGGGGGGGGGYTPTPSASRPDYYGALGVTPSASAADLRAAYLRTARASHPDTYRGGDAAGAAERFRRASAAYEVLRDKDLRARYDAGL